jgi:hypothetical protein
MYPTVVRMASPVASHASTDEYKSAKSERQEVSKEKCIDSNAYLMTH